MLCPWGILFDGGHDALLGSDLIAFNLHYAEISWETEFLVKRGRHGLQFMQPSSAHDCCIRGWHVYHQIFSLLPDWSLVNCHCDPAHWPNAFPRKSYQWSVVGLEVRLYETESVKQVWVHYFRTTALIYQHSLDIRISNSQFNY